MLKFNYIGYESSFISEIDEKKIYGRKKLFIFSDNRMRNIFYKSINGKILEELPTFITIQELKEKIFFTEKTVLKEAKRILFFYKSLSNEVKKELNIESYYDVIDIADDFYNYYQELYLADVEDEKLQNLEISQWQKRYVELFSQIKQQLDLALEQEKFLPNDWLEKKEFYRGEWLERFEEINFIDIVDFPKLYIEIIKNLKSDVIFYLQMREGEFDEENFKIKDLKIPNIYQDIEIFNTKNPLETSISLIYFNEQEMRGNIFSPIAEKNRFHNYFPNYFFKNSNYFMKDTGFIKLFEQFISIIIQKEERLGDTFPIDLFVEAFEKNVFLKYYGLDYQDREFLATLLKNDIKYISIKILEKNSWLVSQEFIESMIRILQDLKQIESIKNSGDLHNFITKRIYWDKLLEDNFDNGDIFDKIFEVVGMMKQNENLIIIDDEKKYFGDKIGVGIFRFFVTYIKDLGIKNKIKNDGKKYVVREMKATRYYEDYSANYNYFIDVTSENLPKKYYDRGIFTEKQKKILGILGKDEKKDVERYRFFQNVFVGKKSVIFTTVDEEKNIEISPFLEEIIKEKRLKIKEAPVPLEQCVKILEKNIKTGELERNVEFFQDEFVKNIDDFNERKFKVTAYSYGELERCPALFYFKNILKLEDKNYPEKEELGVKLFGIIIHKILEDITVKKWKDILSNNSINIDGSEIREEFEKNLCENRDKIPVYLDGYLKEVILPIIIANINKFFNRINSEYEGSNITRFQSEKRSNSTTPFLQDKLDVYLDGRVDLLIESNIGKEIIDYKTGGKNEEQLDFYSILLFDDENVARKKYVNIWNGEIKESDKIVLTVEKLKEKLKNFVESEIYSKSEKKTDCIKCKYQNICRTL